MFSFDAPRHNYEWNLFDRMSATHQYAVATTIGFGGHDAATPDWTLAQYVRDCYFCSTFSPHTVPYLPARRPGPCRYDDFCAANAQAWFDYAAREPRMGGVFPWYWRTVRATDQVFPVVLTPQPYTPQPSNPQPQP